MDNPVKKVTVFQYAVIVFLVVGGFFFALKDFETHNSRDNNNLSENKPVINFSGSIVPIPLNIELDARKVALGDKLYHDKRLSKDDSISCASCHDLAKGGTDQVKYSTGIKNAVGGINSPTTFNSGFNFVQFWDGRAQDLAEQAPGPVHNPIEMGSNWAEVITKLKKDSQYIKAFAEIYPDNIKPENIADAIAVFEMSLITPNSRFDNFLRGDSGALNEQEKEGYRIFKEYGCISCHQGINIGGNMYQTIGIMEDYFQHRPLTDADLGRFNITKLEYNKYQFKVPSLRNIAVTFPYLHDGSAETMEEVLSIMWNSQLGRSLTQEENEHILLFLNTLTGEYKGNFLDASMLAPVSIAWEDKNKVLKAIQTNKQRSS
ncbi:MAG: cytochrome-c peroxidase [Proteobacteria bacterium]|nr:cytochrome-c peroxidase [Pseudomonadota bacterium]